MKKLSLPCEGAGIFLAFVLVAAAFVQPAAAQDVTKSQILQNKADEQDVRLHAAAVVSQIQSLIDELQANGISGDDIKVLNATKAALTNLSGPEMERVIASLQKAGDASNPATRQQNVIDAYAAQKGIILQFRQILKDYEQRQAAYELPVRFKRLAAQQTETMLTSVNIARATAGKSAGELTNMQQTTEQIVQADQAAIGNEVKLAGDQLDKAVEGSTDDDSAPMRQAQKDMKTGVLQRALDNADDDLKVGQLLKATSEQKIARDELRQIAQDLNPPSNAVDALKATAVTLAKVIEEQKNLLDQTNAAIDSRPRVTGLDEKQGALVDETNSLQQDMQSLSAPAAALVQDAITPMQISRAALSPREGSLFDKAAKSQEEAIAKLEEAQKQLQQQVADAEKAAQDAAKDPVAKLQDLQKQIQTAMQQQQQITTQTNQAANAAPPDKSATAQVQQQQAQLQQQTSALQTAAEPLSLDASKALATAANQMNQAQQDLNDPSKAPDTQASQQAAQAALANANQQIAQQIAQAQQQAADPSALAQAANALQQAQSSVSTAIADTTQPPVANTPANTTDAAAALAAAGKDAQTAANTPGLPAAAATAVQQAQAAIAQGQQQAAHGNAPATANSAAAAQQALAQAQAAVAMAQAGLAPGGAPQPGTPGPALPGPDTPSPDGAKSITGGSTDKGTLHNTMGNGKFVSVAARDRTAIDQTQTEKRPQEYAPLIDQYMKNLADQSSYSSP